MDRRGAGIIEVTEARQGAVATFFDHVNTSPVYRIPLTKTGRARFLRNFSTWIKRNSIDGSSTILIFILSIWIVFTRGVTEKERILLDRNIEEHERLK